MWYEIIGIIVAIITAIVVLPMLWKSDVCDDLRKFIQGKRYDIDTLALSCVALFILFPVFTVVVVFIWPGVVVVGTIAGVLWGLRLRNLVKEKLEGEK